MSVVFKITTSTSTLVFISLLVLFNIEQELNAAIACKIGDLESASNVIAQPNNDTWVLCNVFGAISVLSTNYNWFSANNPNPCTNGSTTWSFITCNDQDRVTGLGNFNTADSHNITAGQFINTTYWPEKIKSIIIYGNNFLSGELHFDNLPNTTQTVMIRSGSDWSNFSMNISQFPNLVHCNNLIKFRLNNIYFFGENSHIELINNLPIHLQNFQLKSKNIYRYMWTLDKFPNFINFTELKELDINGCNVNDTESFVNKALPPNIEVLEANYNKLTGKLEFSSLFEYKINKTGLKRVKLAGNVFDSVNFIGIGENTDITLYSEIVCDPNGYFMFKDDEIGNPNYSISEYNLCEIKISRAISDCAGMSDCFNSYCLCFTIPNDWEPGLNDFYTISLALVLISFAVTSIAFAKVNCFNFDLIYLKLISIQIIMTMVAWFWFTLILEPNISDEKKDALFETVGSIIAGYWVFVLYPLSMMLCTLTNFSNFYFMKKFNWVTKIKIDNKYKDLIQSDDIHGCKYFIIGPNAIDNNKNDYWKLKNDNCFAYKCNRKHNINICNYAVSITMCQVFYACWIWSILIVFATFSLCCNWVGNIQLTNAHFGVWVILLQLLVIKMILMIGSRFQRYHFCLAEFGIILLDVWIQYITIGDGAENFSSQRNFLFKTGDYYGVVDELNTGKQGTVLTYMKDVVVILATWLMILFCLISTILYIKCNRRAKIKDSYIFQLNVTVVSVFTGLLDYLTDILVIMYWINHELYVYAALEMGFIVLGQIAATYLIRDVPYYADHNCGDMAVISKHNTKKISCSYNVVKNLMFGLGFSRIYHSVKRWDNKLIEYEYNWCKLWELMFESIPSVVLSTYVAFIDTTTSTSTSTNNQNVNLNEHSQSGQSLNPSVIISMVFSFINITNTIVVIFTKDQNNNVNKNKDRNTNSDSATTNIVSTASISLAPSVKSEETIAAQLMGIDLQITKLKRNKSERNEKDQNMNEQDNARDNENKQKQKGVAHPQDRSGLQLPSDLWIVDTTTNEVKFFAEETKQPSHKNNTTARCDTSKCKKHYERLCVFLFHFDAKMKNFMIWLFLTTDLFLRVLSVLSVIMVVNYVFLGQDSINSDSNWFILQSFYATALNLIFLIYVLIIEYLLFGFMLAKNYNYNVNQSRIDRCRSLSSGNHPQNSDNYNVKKMAIFKRNIQLKYFVVGLFSNCFYFLLTIGVEYIPAMIDKKLFFKYQQCRTVLSIFFFCCHVLGNFWLDVFMFELYSGFAILLLLHCISLWYVKIYV